MKKYKVIYSVLMLVLLVITSCKEEGEEFLAKKLKLSTNEQTLDVGEEQVVEVLSGNGEYKVTLSNEDSIKAEFKGKKLFIKGLKEGEVKLTITDAEGEKAFIEVQVTSPKGIKLSVKELIIVKGTHEIIKILDGNGDYKIKFSKDILNVEIKEGEIHVDALKEGESTLTITDGKGEEFSVNVMVSSLKKIKLSVYELYLEKGSEGNINILEGNGNYKVTGSNSLVGVKVENEIIHVNAIKEGTVNLKIVDDKGQEASVKVIVSSLKKIKLSSYELNLVKGGKGEINILDGNGDYTITGSNTIVKAILKDGSITVNGLKEGSTTIKITDKKKKTVFVKIVVSSPKELKLSSYELNLVKGGKGEIKILGGNGVYNVSGSNSSVDAKLKDGVITVSGLKDGFAIIKVTDEKGKTVSVKIVVSSPKELKLSVSKLTLEKGAIGQVKILIANGNCKIDVSKTNVKTELKSGVIYITALAGGTSVIKVTDAKGKTASVNVTVTLPKELKLSTSSLTLKKGAKGEVKILNGNGGYKVVSTAKVNAKIISGIIHLTAIEGGTSIIKITDAKGKTVSIKVTVTLPKELKLSTSSLTLEKGAIGQVKILDGNGGYKVVSTAKVSAKLISGVIYLTALEGGTTTINVTDAKGKTASVNVTVNLPKELRLSTSKLTIEKGSKGSINILDGNGGYELSVSNNNIKAEIKSGVINVIALVGGTASIKVTDAKGKTASVNVVVSDSPSIVKDPLFNEIHRIKVITVEGHLHGSYLHGNGGNQTPRHVKQYFILEKNAEGHFVHLTKTGVKGYINPGKSIVVLGRDFYGEKWTPRYAYEFVYYNKAGERLEEKFLKNKEMYQTLFSIEKYKVLATNEIKNVTTKDFMSYTYRDTNPATNMYSKSSDIEGNFLGFKGYGYVNKARISYTLKVNFVKYKKAGDKVNSIFLEDANQSQFEEKIQLDVPIVIPVGRSHDDQIKIMAAYFNMSVEEYDKLFWLSNPPESSRYYM